MTIFRSKAFGRFVAFALVLTMPGLAVANELREMSAGELMSEAELVVLAEATDCIAIEVSGEDARCSFRVLAILKGRAPETFDLARSSVIAEATVFDCCETGQRYLMFLERRGRHYASVNGIFGVKHVSRTARRVSPQNAER